MRLDITIEIWQADRDVRGTYQPVSETLSKH